MVTFRLEAGSNRNIITIQKLIEKTGMIGLKSKQGRYGGTWTHSDITLIYL